MKHLIRRIKLLIILRSRGIIRSLVRDLVIIILLVPDEVGSVSYFGCFFKTPDFSFFAVIFEKNLA